MLLHIEQAMGYTATYTTPIAIGIKDGLHALIISPYHLRKRASWIQTEDLTVQLLTNNL